MKKVLQIYYRYIPVRYKHLTLPLLVPRVYILHKKVREPYRYIPIWEVKYFTS